MFVLVILPLVAMGVSALAIYHGIQNYVAESSYFKIRELKVEGIADERYLEVMRGEILGHNMFKVDSANLATQIRKRFPTFTSVRVTRVLPSQLWITAKERLPLLILKRDLYYVFDADGVAISGLSSSGIFDLPVVLGLENQLPRVKVGVEYSSPLLHKALLLARVLKSHAPEINASMPQDLKIKVTKIDVSDPGNLLFILGDAVQVKVGDKNFEERLIFLPSILRSVGTDLLNIKYIDLRPREPVVASKINKKS